MPELLKLIPLKGWLYAAIALALLAFGLHYRSLERQLEASKVVAQQATAVVKKDEAQAVTQEVQNANVYTQTVSVPAIPDIGIKCVRDTPSRSPLPPAHALTSTLPRVDAPVSGEGPHYDPSGAALTVGRDDDALIKALQDQVNDLVSRMNGSSK